MAAARSAGGARWARTCAKSLTNRYAGSSCQRPPTSEPSTTTRCGPPALSSEQAARLRRLATRSIAPSFAAVRGCGWPVRVLGRIAAQRTPYRGSSINHQIQAAPVESRCCGLPGRQPQRLRVRPLPMPVQRLLFASRARSPVRGQAQA